MAFDIHLHNSLEGLSQHAHVGIVGRTSALAHPALDALTTSFLPGALWRRLVSSTTPGTQGRVQSTLVLNHENVERVHLGALPDKCSRHNSPTMAFAVPHVLRTLPRSGNVGLVLVAPQRSHIPALVMAVARCFPSYSATSRTREGSLSLYVVVVGEGAVGISPALQTAFHGVRQSAAWVDAPPNVMTPTRFKQVALAFAKNHESVSSYVVEGQRLAEMGFGGLWGVGKASPHPPALVVLDYTPEGEGPQGAPHAWLGKGITYDTGGLSLKSKTTMPSMKTDMGGAAAVLGAFMAAVSAKVSHPITAVLCVAENAVGPHATRPDDVLHMYSGKTVEVNNTDAEGRLVLADGLAWVTRHREPAWIVQLAPLTGAQGVATGRLHAGLYAEQEDAEALVVHMGRSVGELAHPLPYAPEFYFKEFHSQIADMRNSVKDRSNAQSSCAAEFIRQHKQDTAAAWIHLDIAAPAVRGGRGTGFGTGLLMGLVGAFQAYGIQGAELP